MKLYYTPGACSLATHIALLEAGFDFELERVDLKRKVTEAGVDFIDINPKGYVPALLLDSGDVLTENPAVLDWIATAFPPLGVGGPLGRTRLIAMLSYISSEVHKGFKPYWHAASAEDKADAEIQLLHRLRWLVDQFEGRYLFGDTPTVADLYLFVMVRWTARFDIAIPQALAAFHDRIMARPLTRAAISFEESPVIQAANA